MKKITFLLLCCIGIVCTLQAQIKDIQINTSLQSPYQSARLALVVSWTEGNTQAATLQCRLTDPHGTMVAEVSHSLSSDTQQTRLELPEISQPQLWNAEAPVLYTLDLCLQAKDKSVLHRQQRPVAIRHIEMTEKEMHVNGQPVRIKGVNLRSVARYPQNHPWLHDVEQWKLHHVNAIRISDRPRDNRLYELCDRYGIYVLSEDEGYDPTHPALREGCLWEWPNRDLPVKLEEMKKLYQDIRFFDFDREAGTVSIQNLQAFTRLNRYKFHYLIRDHGKVVYRNELKGVDAAPGETFVYRGLKGIDLERHTTGDVRIEFYAQHRTPAPFFEQGSEAAREQTYIHTFFRPARPAATPAQAVKKSETDSTLAFAAPNLQVVFHKESGRLVSYRYRHEEYLHQSQGLQPFFWRAPTPNDRLAQLPRVLQAWKEASYQPLKAAALQCSAEKDGSYTLKVTYRFPQTDAQWDLTYRIHADGVLKVDNRFVAEGNQAPMIPRVGLRMQLVPAFTTVRYFGRGPRTNYRDCRTAQFLGDYTSAIAATTECVDVPQENGHRTDIYWCAIEGSLQGGLLLVADRTFELNLSDCLLEDLEAGTLQPSDRIDCFIDYRMMGIGPDNRPGTPVQEPYLIRPGQANAIEYGFTLVPFDKHEDFQRLIVQYK